MERPFLADRPEATGNAPARERVPGPELGQDRELVRARERAPDPEPGRAPELDRARERDAEAERASLRRPPYGGGMGTSTKSPSPVNPIGTGGFEPPTPCSQSRCATRLRHVPRPGGVYQRRSAALAPPKVAWGQWPFPSAPRSRPSSPAPGPSFRPATAGSTSRSGTASARSCSSTARTSRSSHGTAAR